MEIDIRHLEKVKEGVLMYALVSNIARPSIPHYLADDTEEEKLKKNDEWKDELKIFGAKEKEINMLHLNKAKLIQGREE